MKNRKDEAAKKYIKDIKSADVWSVFRILADFVKGFDELGELGPTVTIFGSARTPEDNYYYQQAQKLSSLLAAKGFNIMTGGGPGIMEAANRGAKEHKDVESVGLNINLPFEQVANKYTTKDLEFEYFFSRKVMLVKYSMAYVILPGGFGTLDELFEALTLIQTRKVTGVKIFVIGTEFYQPLLDFINTKLYASGMIDQEDVDMIKLTDDIECVAQDIEESLTTQMNALEDFGLDDTSYYKSLHDFSKEKNIQKDNN